MDVRVWVPGRNNKVVFNPDIKVESFSAMCDSIKQLLADVDGHVAASVDGKIYLISLFAKSSKLKATKIKV